MVAVLGLEKPVYFMSLIYFTHRFSKLLFHASRLNVPVGGGDHLVSEALYFNDPEGNGIEVYQDRPSEDWQWDGNFVKWIHLQ